MWIAFKNYYLRDTTQHRVDSSVKNARCELLSKIIIFVTRHNPSNGNEVRFLVVNCFQKLLSSWHDTTRNVLSKRTKGLWIAFKNYYLRDTTQPEYEIIDDYISCELLSKIIIFVTRHNYSTYLGTITAVVNCFQKLLSSWHDTTTTSFK